MIGPDDMIHIDLLHFLSQSIRNQLQKLMILGMNSRLTFIFLIELLSVWVDHSQQTLERHLKRKEKLLMKWNDKSNKIKTVEYGTKLPVCTM